MKIFSTLSDIHKERALHMAEHLVMNGLLESGIHGEPENAEEREQLEELKKHIEYAKTLSTPDEQVEYLLHNEITTDLILDQAYQIATSAIYIEEDETVFYIKDIDSHYIKKSSNESREEDEKEFAELVANSKRDTKHLN